MNSGHGGSAIPPWGDGPSIASIFSFNEDAMALCATISPDKLWRRLGRPDAPILIDVRSDGDFTADPRLIPGARRRPGLDAPSWGPGLAGRRIVAIRRHGRRLGQGAAAWLRAAGAEAGAPEGGVDAWTATAAPLVPAARIPAARIPAADARGRSLRAARARPKIRTSRSTPRKALRVTRARPKIDGIAYPWLIRRFADPGAVFLFVPPAKVPAVAARFGATPFDIDGMSAFWTHRGELCAFDAMVAEFGPGEVAPLARLARVVRGADTARLDLEPEAVGLLAISLGLSRLHIDDLAQLGAGLGPYDALWRWRRDASAETRTWPAAQHMGAA